jgi:hypothetical protein
MPFRPIGAHLHGLDVQGFEKVGRDLCEEVGNSREHDLVLQLAENVHIPA